VTQRFAGVAPEQAQVVVCAGHITLDVAEPGPQRD
jgi:hypothetical protein